MCCGPLLVAFDPEQVEFDMGDNVPTDDADAKLTLGGPRTTSLLSE